MPRYVPEKGDFAILTFDPQAGREQREEGCVGDQSLATRAVRGAFWTGGGLGIQLIVTLIFYRMLDLEAMGYFTWALRIAVLFPLIGTLGLNDALVRHKDARDAHFSAAFWACLGFGCALYLTLFFGAPALGMRVAGWARDVDAHAFASALQPLAAIIPAASVSGVMRARLARKLNFRAIALGEVISVLIAAGVGLGLLAGGYGIESAVWNAVVREFALLACLWIAVAWMPALSFRWRAIRDILGFGLNVAGANIVNYIANNLDKGYFIPIYLGPVATALYSFVYQYTMTPLSHGGSVLTRVIFPAFSVVQENDRVLRRGYTRTFAGIALLSWPVLAASFIYAREILSLVKGEAMLPALVPLKLLIAAGMLKAVGTVVGSVFLAKGKANWSFRWTVANLIVFIPALFWGVRYGIEGVAAVISGTAVLFLVVTQLLVNHLIDLRMIDYLKAYIRPLLTTIWVAIALLAVRSHTDLGAVETLLLGGSTGAIAYAVGIRLFAWPFVTRFWHDFRGQKRDR